MANDPEIKVEGDEEARVLSEALLVHVLNCGASGYHITFEINGQGERDGEAYEVIVKRKNPSA